MAERTEIEQILARVVTQVLESHVPQLREELVRRVLEELPSQLSASLEASPANLLKAVAAIHAGSTQREILRALLDNAVRYSGRCALFVIKAGAATGWQGRAFANSDAIKDFTLDVSTGVAARALQARIAVTGSAAEMDPHFVSQFGAPGDDHVLIVPLLLKDKVAALVYADTGGETGGNMDAAALELLVVSTGARLEVAALRKQAHKEGAAEPGVAVAERGEAAPVQAVSALSDAFAGHAPAPAVETVPPGGEAPAAEAVETSSVPAPVAIAEAGAADPFAQLPPEDAEVHRKALRFAKLLVDEIKLYNQAKVAEGRKNKDLYDRLKEDIEKSRATYQKRFGNTVAAGGDYFHAEIVRSLAEDDNSIMGANFRR